MTRVLLVEDEVVLRTAMRVSLTRDGYVVTEAADAGAAIHHLASASPAAILLDLGLPDMDGIDLLSRLRHMSGAVIVVVTALDDRPTTVRALDAGADDYVTKPFHTDVLLARLRAALRRSDLATEPHPAPAGGLRVELAARSVTRDGTAVTLTRTERRLLEALITHPGALQTHAELLREVWGPAYATETTYLRTFVRQLRAKLGDDADSPRYIATEPGVGYRWIAKG